MVRATLLHLLRSPRKQFTATSYQTGFLTSKVARWELASNTSYLGAVSALASVQQQRWASGGPSTGKDKKETETETGPMVGSLVSHMKNLKQGFPSSKVRSSYLGGAASAAAATMGFRRPVN